MRIIRIDRGREPETRECEGFRDLVKSAGIGDREGFCIEPGFGEDVKAIVGLRSRTKALFKVDGDQLKDFSEQEVKEYLQMFALPKR